MGNACYLVRTLPKLQLTSASGVSTLHRVNQASLLNPPLVGELAVNNWTVYDGSGPDAKLVARAQGLHINAASLHNSDPSAKCFGTYEK